MKTHISLSDLGCDKWYFPEGITTAAEKENFVRGLPLQGSLLVNGDYKSIKDYRILKGKLVPLEMIESLREKAFKKMEEGLAFWLVKKSRASNIEKSWIAICFYKRLIQTEFDLLFAAEYRLLANYDILSDDKTIQLWQSAYLKWKPQIEAHIKYITEAHIAPDFSELVAIERAQNQEYLNNLLYNTHRKPRGGNCTDGEAEFWRAVNNGDLDAIGF